MNSKRVLAVVKKDVRWAQSNLKLLTVMVLPIFLIIFFSSLDKAVLFNFSMAFINSFLGIFSTSYLIIEEKNNGTLLALLTSPLTASELLMGKFLFNVILCGLFSLMVILVNGRLEVLTSPLALVSIFLFAGTTCFVGYLLGVFFKNEQEMSLFAPILMLLFCFGDSADKLSTKKSLFPFFPDYYMLQVVSEPGADVIKQLPYVAVSLILFSLTYAMATSYTQFYFSNNCESRWSKKLFGYIITFMLVIFVSGMNFSKEDEKGLQVEGLMNQAVKTKNFAVSFAWNPMTEKRKVMLHSPEKIIETHRPLPKGEHMLVFVIRSTDEESSTVKRREKTVREDKKRLVLSYAGLDNDFYQWNYEKRGQFIVLREKICGEEILQVSMDLALKDMKDLTKAFEHYERFFSSLKVQCF